MTPTAALADTPPLVSPPEIRRGDCGVCLGPNWRRHTLPVPTVLPLATAPLSALTWDPAERSRVSACSLSDNMQLVPSELQSPTTFSDPALFRSALPTGRARPELGFCAEIFIARFQHVPFLHIALLFFLPRIKETGIFSSFVRLVPACQITGVVL
ncbi:hypothetical protein AOLI_G00039410 [Acnodon oligacanthus]